MNNVGQIQDAYFSGKISLIEASRNLDILGYNPRERSQILASMRSAQVERHSDSKSLHEELGLKGSTRRQEEASERAATLRQRIRTSEIVITVHNSERRCIPEAGVPRADYDFVGSGIVFYGQMLIERFDVEHKGDEVDSINCPLCDDPDNTPPGSGKGCTCPKVEW